MSRIMFALSMSWHYLVGYSGSMAITQEFKVTGHTVCLNPRGTQLFLFSGPLHPATSHKKYAYLTL